MVRRLFRRAEEDEKMAFDVHDCIAFLTNSGGKSLDESMNKRFRGQDITRTQWTALYYIDRIKGITQKQLAEAMMISGPSASNLVDRLEAAGFVQREEDSENGRVKHLVLTGTGKTKLDELAHIPVEFNEEAVKDLTPEEVEIFKHVLAKMVDSVKE